jgi:putative methyltransferase (TIGR04325 family)
VLLQKIFKTLFYGKIKNFSRVEKSLVAGNSNSPWAGEFDSWNEALLLCNSYNADIIVEKCRSSLLKIKSGLAKYERDSVLFDEVQYSWPLLAGLQNAALQNNGKLSVLDFGGSLGSTYYQNKNFLKECKHLEWCIIEQPKFVKYGKQDFEDNELKFYATIEECLLSNKPDVLILSSVLQYIGDPFELIRKIIKLNIPNIIVDRTAFVVNEKDILTIQNVPKEIYEASYPAWFFNREKLLKSFEGYLTITSFPSFCDNPIVLNSEHNAYWGGFILKAI